MRGCRPGCRVRPGWLWARRLPSRMLWCTRGRRSRCANSCDRAQRGDRRQSASRCASLHPARSRPLRRPATRSPPTGWPLPLRAIGRSVHLVTHHRVRPDRDREDLRQLGQPALDPFAPMVKVPPRGASMRTDNRPRLRLRMTGVSGLGAGGCRKNLTCACPGLVV